MSLHQRCVNSTGQHWQAWTANCLCLFLQDASKLPANEDIVEKCLVERTRSVSAPVKRAEAHRKARGSRSLPSLDITQTPADRTWPRLDGSGTRTVVPLTMD
jgi:hypothetical protein